LARDKTALDANMSHFTAAVSIELPRLSFTFSRWLSKLRVRREVWFIVINGLVQKNLAVARRANVSSKQREHARFFRL
jgi:hypothetical protein